MGCSGSTNYDTLYPNNSKRFCDIQYISTKRIAELSDSISPVTGKSYIDHYSGNLWHSKGKFNMWDDSLAFRDDGFKRTLYEQDDCDACNSTEFLKYDGTDFGKIIRDYHLTAFYTMDYPFRTKMHPVMHRGINRNPGFMYRYFRDVLEIKNIRPFGFTEWRIWTDDSRGANQCGIDLNGTLSNVIGTAECLKTFSRGGVPGSDGFPEIEYACYQMLHGVSDAGNGLIFGFGDDNPVLNYYGTDSDDTTCFANFDYELCYNCSLYQKHVPGRLTCRSSEYIVPCDSFYYMNNRDVPSECLWKEGEGIFKFPMYHLFFLYGNHFGDYILSQEEGNISNWVDSSSFWADNLNLYDSTDIDEDAYYEIEDAFKEFSVNSAIKTDGTITIMAISKVLDRKDTLKIKLNGAEYYSFDSVKAYCLTAEGNYAKWDTVMAETWDDAPYDYTHYADYIFMHNNRHQAWADREQYDYVRIMPTDWGDSLLFTVKSGDSVYAYADSFISYLNQGDELYLVSPKHSITAIEIYPSIDTFTCVLDSGWNLISVPVYTGDTELGDIFAASSDEFWVDTTILLPFKLRCIIFRLQKKGVT